MLGVSLALMQFMQVALRITIRTPNDLKFLLSEWELDESDRPIQPSCGCVLTAGLGDTLAITPFVMGEEARKARTGWHEPSFTQIRWGRLTFRPLISIVH